MPIKRQAVKGAMLCALMVLLSSAQAFELQGEKTLVAETRDGQHTELAESNAHPLKKAKPKSVYAWSTP